VTVDIQGFGLMVFCHGTPRDDEEVVRLADRRLVVNSGSIGMPYGRAGGPWALQRDGGIALRHTRVDVKAAIEAVVADSSWPRRRLWAEDYLTATASDAEALAAFAPRNGRRGPA
jgi:hypothetical protein